MFHVGRDHPEGIAKMPRYFFHLASANAEVPDTKGYEFGCAEDAYFHARRIILEAQPYLDEDDGRWIIRIQSAEESVEIIALFPVRDSRHKDRSRPEHGIGRVPG
jgi:hypothetical protein